MYLGLHNQLLKKFGENAVISRKEFFTKTGKHFIMPKSLRPLVLREMEDKKLIERVNRDFVKILKFEIDIETEQNKLYQIFGI